MRYCWRVYLNCLSKDILKTDYFCSFQEFYLNLKNGFIKDNCVIELMCHPGGIYPEEEELLGKISYKELKVNLINFNQL